MDDVIKVRWRYGLVYAVTPQWLRITNNPDAPGYPHVADVIDVQGHALLADGRYLVVAVTEFEPPLRPDGDGHDIRLSLIGEHGDSHRDLNGQRLVRAIVGEWQEAERV